MEICVFQHNYLVGKSDFVSLLEFDNKVYEQKIPPPMDESSPGQVDRFL
jgi:hypothetical protein